MVVQEQCVPVLDNLSNVKQDVELMLSGEPVYQSLSYKTFQVTSDQAPHLLQYISVERQKAYNLSGLGYEALSSTYDSPTHHFITWDVKRNQCVAYCRMFLVDNVFYNTRCDAIYTIQKKVLIYTNSYVELGGLAVMPGYQKSLRALVTLYRGVGRVIKSIGPRFVVGSVSTPHSIYNIDVLGYLDRYIESRSKVLETRHQLPSGLVVAREKSYFSENLDAQLLLEVNECQNLQTFETLMMQYSKLKARLSMLCHRYEQCGAMPLACAIDPVLSHSLEIYFLFDFNNTAKKKTRQLMFGI
jgi:hypothetical protein